MALDLHIFPLLPCWLSGKESACQCRRCRFNPPLKKEMATHSSILAWKIPWTEEPGGLQSMASQRVGHNWATNRQMWGRGLKLFTLPSVFYISSLPIFEISILCLSLHVLILATRLECTLTTKSLVLNYFPVFKTVDLFLSILQRWTMKDFGNIT